MCIRDSLISGGFVVPLRFLPSWIEKIALLLPFPYAMYFPILAWMGKLSVGELFQVIGMQIMWILLFFGLFTVLWKKGVREYSGVSQ